MKKLTRDLLAGLSLLLPIVLSIQLFIWLFRTVEAWLKPLWELVLPQAWYLPGMAIFSFLLLALLVGISFRVRVIGLLWQYGNDLVGRIPVLNYVYNIIKDFFDLIGGQDFSDHSVVWVRLADSPYKLLGVVTKHGDDKDSRLGQLISADEVAVYLPMSYQLGGYMVVLPKANVESVDIKAADALRLIMSAGLGQKKKSQKQG